MKGKIFVIDESSDHNKWSPYLSPEDIFDDIRFWGDSIKSIFDVSHLPDKPKYTPLARMKMSMEKFKESYPEFIPYVRSDFQGNPYILKRDFVAVLWSFAKELEQDLKERAREFIRGALSFESLKHEFRKTDLGDISIIQGHDFYPNSIEILRASDSFPDTIYFIDVYVYHV